MNARKLALAAILLSSPPALAADPWTPAPEPGGARVAIAVEGVTGATADEIEAAARDSLTGCEIVDSGAVRSARSFAAMGGELDDAKAERLRRELAVDRLLVVQVRDESGKRFLVARAVDASGVSRKYAEAEPEGLGGSVRDLVAQLPPPPAGTGRVAMGASTVALSSPAHGPVSAPPRAPRAAPGTGSGPYVNLDVLLAMKQMKSDDWRPIQDQYELGIAGTFGGEAWPIHFAGDFYRSQGSDTTRGYDIDTGAPVDVEFSGSTTEIGFGVRKIFVADVLRPHVGGGLTLVSADVEARADGYGSSSDSDTALGPWIAGGAMIRAGQNMNIGMLVRWSSATVDLNDVSGDAGGLHFGITIGGGFGSASTR